MGFAGDGKMRVGPAKKIKMNDTKIPFNFRVTDVLPRGNQNV